MAMLSFNRDRERFMIRELVKIEERTARTRTTRNKGNKEED